MAAISEAVMPGMVLWDAKAGPDIVRRAVGWCAPTGQSGVPAVTLQWLRTQVR